VKEGGGRVRGSVPELKYYSELTARSVVLAQPATNDEDQAKIKDVCKRSQLPVVPSEWLLTSVGTWDLRSCNDYLLCPTSCHYENDGMMKETSISI